MNENYKLSIREGWVSGIANVILFALKLWAGIVSGSIALIADAWHTLTDTISSVIVVAGLRIASKPPDEEHPYGHGRAEILTTIIIGVLLVIVGIHFAESSIMKLTNKESASFGIVAIIVTLVSLIVKESMAQFAFYIAKKANTNSVRADGWHHRSDAISSGIILIGIFFKSKFWWIDGVLGILVSVVIFYSAYIIIRNTIDLLLGTKPDDKMGNQIKNIGKKIYKGNLRFHHFHVHAYGYHIEITFHIVLPENLKLEEASMITKKLHEEIKGEMNIFSTIHIDTKSKY